VYWPIYKESQMSKTFSVALIGAEKTMSVKADRLKPSADGRLIELAAGPVGDDAIVAVFPTERVAYVADASVLGGAAGG
jgi:hypothetical protein